MASIDKRGAKWRVRWRDPDGGARSRSCPTRRAAQALQREVEEAVALGRRWEPHQPRVSPRLVEVAAAYLHDRARVCQPRTIVATGSRLQNLLRAYEAQGIPEPTLADLSREALSDAWVWMRTPGTGAKGKGVSVRTANGNLGTWEQLWRWAFDHDHFGPDCPRPRRVERARAPSPVTPAPTWGEVDAMVAELAGRRRYRNALPDWQLRTVLIVRYTGCRIGAARTLLWEDVDLVRGALTFRAENVKTKRGRTIPLHPALQAEIVGWGRREGRVSGIEGRIKSQHRNMAANYAAPAWLRTDARPGVYTGRPVHCIRRAWRTQLVAAGVHPDVIDALLGHRGRGVGGAVYTDPAHLWPQMVEAVGLVPAVGAGGRVVALSSGHS